MGLSLEWNNEYEAFDLPPEWVDRLERILQQAGRSEGIETGEVALSFVDDETIRGLNRDYRDKDQPTDVLSFAMRESVEGEEDVSVAFPDQPVLLGDIVISVPRAMAQSEEYGHSLERELGFLFLHGFLHLIGYDHQDEASEREMFAKQEQILQEAGLTR